MNYARNLKATLIDALTDSPVVMINGARQVGKSTLVKDLFEDDTPYVTFDDLTSLAAARSSPDAFVEGLPDRVILDEVQRVPEIMLALKRSVDKKKQPGRFVITGSANVLALPAVADTLVGRMEVHTLWPLSMGEIEGTRENFLDLIFRNELRMNPPAVDQDLLLDKVIRGGYPEAVNRKDARRRSAWFRSYLTTILQRDIQDLSNIEGLTAFPNLIAMLATRISSLSNVAELSRATRIPATTLSRYLSLLRMIFLTVELPPWSNNLGKRLVRSPKLFLNDTGLASHLLGLDAQRIKNDRNLFGPLLENFVVIELMKQASWADNPPTLFHYRTQTGQEVDIVLELPDGTMCGIEIKAATQVKSEDFKGLRALKEVVGKRFIRGLVLYTGSQVSNFDRDLTAVPISAIWNGGAPDRREY